MVKWSLYAPPACRHLSFEKSFEAEIPCKYMLLHSFVNWLYALLIPEITICYLYGNPLAASVSRAVMAEPDGTGKTGIVITILFGGCRFLGRRTTDGLEDLLFLLAATGKTDPLQLLVTRYSCHAQLLLTWWHKHNHSQRWNTCVRSEWVIAVKPWLSGVERQTWATLLHLGFRWMRDEG